MPHIHRRACNLCEAICGLQVEMDGQRIVSIKGDPDDPHSKGFICPKALALKDLQEDPDRIRQPMRRTADGWEPVSWEVALDEAGRAIAAIQRRDGMDALGIYWGNPPTHNHGLILTMNPVFDALRTRNRYSAASIDQLPQYLVSLKMFGNQLMFPVPDVDRTQFWLILGGNPLASNGSVGSGPDMRGRIKAIQARGGQVVVVDPRRTETAHVASAHLSIRPGGDVWLLLALLQVVSSESLARPGRVPQWTDGLDAVMALVQDVTPESVTAETGLPAEAIRQLARDFAAADSAVAYGRLGVCQTPNATLTHWLINVLNAVTGNLDRPGGAMFSTPAFDIMGLAKLFAGGGRFGRWKSRVRGLPEFSDELPVATLADEMCTLGKGQIKAMLLVAGNPVLSSPNGARLEVAMRGLEYCVAVDFYINASTCHAHLILPPVTVCSAVITRRPWPPCRCAIWRATPALPCPSPNRAWKTGKY
jgi:anaerobic selenocysteine-containing dehydrogenase